MRKSTIAALVGCAVLSMPSASVAADRGPSTPEECKQALQYIRDFETNPLSSESVQRREWVLKWIIEVSDIHVSMRVILDKLPKGNKKDSSDILVAETFSQTAFLIQNPDKQGDLIAQYQAGVEGALKVYEVLLAANPKDRQTFLDDLVQQRNQGSLGQWVKQRASASCNN